MLGAEVISISRRHGIGAGRDVSRTSIPSHTQARAPLSAASCAGSTEQGAGPARSPSCGEPRRILPAIVQPTGGRVSAAWQLLAGPRVACGSLLILAGTEGLFTGPADEFDVHTLHDFLRVASSSSCRAGPERQQLSWCDRDIRDTTHTSSACRPSLAPPRSRLSAPIPRTCFRGRYLESRRLRPPTDTDHPYRELRRSLRPAAFLHDAIVDESHRHDHIRFVHSESSSFGPSQNVPEDAPCNDGLQRSQPQ